MHIHASVTRDARSLDLALCTTASETCTAAYLRRASRAVSKTFDDAMRPAGLRISQFSALVTLVVAGDVAVSRLADLLALDRTTMTRNLGPLERKGLVASVPGADRRSKVLRITDKGRSALARALPAWQRAQERVVRDLGEPRWKALLQGLKATTSAARQA
jgi:DNA-binding MarR family transcriptional regulator